ncbi:hypothetical protein NA8A_23008 [Nitratireductor indicus C115]|uniref:Uncharacterized protein n=1 Tax=Nitratireductor indicus C115 TaxID=1231190 RepID=K2NQ84_9HYPH|nr:hypothetical protein NA8A_23008 [Nitratireductor indicus C115]SFQ79979.1 hypothetical protein SAMN05216176_11748 [Nitratireductor indicus]
MGRRHARITHDEVCRLIKGVKAAGLDIRRVEFDGEQISVFVGDHQSTVSSRQRDDSDLLLEPKL